MKAAIPYVLFNTLIYLHNILFCIISNIEIYVMSINILTIRIFGNIFSLHKGMLSEKQSTWKQATITTSSLVRNLGVIFEDQLTFKDHIAKTVDLAGLPYTTSERSGTFWRSMLHNFLSRPLSFLDWRNLAGIPSCTIKLLQMIQNAATRLVCSEPKIAHVTPLFISLHWLPLAARIKFKTLMLAYRTTTGSAPAYFHSLMTIYIPSRSLRSVSERRLVVPSQRGS